MAPPKDIARSYPKRGLTADVGFRSEPKFCGDGSAEFSTGIDGTGTYTNTLGDTLSMCCWVWNDAVANAYFMDVGTNSSKAQISISYHNGTGAGINSRPYIWNGSAVITATQEMAAQEWHHLAVTSAPGAGNIKIYLDGVDVTPSHSTDVNITTNDIYLGKWIPGSGNFNGKMANAALFRTTLTQEQVRECMRASSFSQFDAISTLEAFYPLDANFNDSTSGGHDLTVTGSPSFTVDRPQLPRGLDLTQNASMARVYSGRAVDFDGAADVLGGNKYEGGTTKATFCGWFKPDTLPGGVAWLFSNALATGLDSKAQIYLQGTSGGLGIDDTADRVFFSSGVRAGQWHFVAGVYNSTDGVEKAYLDGVLGPAPTAWGSGNTTTSMVFGARSHIAQSPFDGSLANWKIFNVELTQAQIRELYHNPEQVLPTGVSASNLRRYYPLSDYNDTGGTGGRYFQDMGADGEPAEDLGSALMTFAQPVPCPQLGLQQSASRIYFDGVGGGSTGPYWSANLSTAPGATFSLVYWIWYDSSLPSYSMVTEGGGQHYIQTSGNIIWYDGGGTASFNGAFPSSKQDKWSHVVITSTGSSPYVKCYVDGFEQTASGAAGGSGMTATSFTVFARATTPTGFHKGFCANMAIFDDALGSDEVTELFNQGIGYDLRNDTGDYASSADLLNYWLFDDLTSVVDRKGSNNLTNPTSTTFSEMASFPENASGSTIVGDFSMKRKGVSVLNIPASTTNEQAIIPANQDVYPSFANGGSLSLFFRLEKLGTTSTIFINSGYGTTHERFAVYAISSNKIQFELGDGASARANPQTTGTISDSDWHHFAMTVDYGGGSTTTIKLFLDGALDSTSTATTLAGVPNASALELLNRGSGNEGKGPLACFKAYQVTLSENEIEQIYRSDLRLIKGLANE